LYWDTVGSIVPESYQSANSFSPLNQSLLREGLIERISPYDAWNVPRYEQSLIDSIVHGDMILDDARTNFQEGSFEKIHREKFNYFVFQTLEDLHLAQKVATSEWYIVESNIAKLMMTFLATVLALEKGFQPVTDKIVNLDISFNNTAHSDYMKIFNLGEESVEANVRTEILKECMVYPYEANLNAIRRFKDKHYDELKAFRRHIEKIVFNTSLIADPGKRQKALHLEIHDINEQKTALIRRMKESNFNRILFGSACGLLATAAPVIASPSLIGVPALLYGIYTIYKDLQTPKIDSPLYYLALTGHKFKTA